MAKRAKPQIVKIQVRMPPDMHRRLLDSANGNSPPSSLNSEILFRLEKSFESDIERHDEASELAKQIEARVRDEYRDTFAAIESRISKLEK